MSTRPTRLDLERAIVGHLLLEPESIASVNGLLGLLSDEPKRVLAAAARCPALEGGGVPTEALLAALKSGGFDPEGLGALLAPYVAPSVRANDLPAAVEQLRKFDEKPAPAPSAAFDSGSRKRPAQGSSLDLDDPEPHTEPEPDGARLLSEVAATIQRFVVVRSGAEVTLSLWVAMTYLTESVSVLPRLLLASPTKACGKTRLLTVLGALVRRPLLASSISPSALFRAIESGKPTLLLDEMDNAGLSEAPDLRAVLNSGHTPATAFTVRTVGDHHEVRRFSTWAPVALACIGRLPDTVASRCVRVPMERRPPGQAVERLREHRLKAGLEPLRRRIARWCRDHAAEVRAAEPGTPDGLSDRDADNWTPLLAIADLAGADWPERARREAAATVRDAGEDGSAAETVLSDLRDLFDQKDTDRIPSAEVVAALVEREDRPWSEWRHGQGLKQRGLAVLLRGFGIESRVIRTPDGRTPRGYLREHFEEAWNRYLPPKGVLKRNNATRRMDTGRNAGFEAQRPERLLRIENTVSPATDAPCGVVALGTPPEELGRLSGATCSECGGRVLRWGDVLACSGCHRRVNDAGDDRATEVADA